MEEGIVVRRRVLHVERWGGRRGISKWRVGKCVGVVFVLGEGLCTSDGCGLLWGLDWVLELRVRALGGIGRSRGLLCNSRRLGCNKEGFLRGLIRRCHRVHNRGRTLGRGFGLMGGGREREIGRRKGKGKTFLFFCCCGGRVIG